MVRLGLTLAAWRVRSDDVGLAGVAVCLAAPLTVTLGLLPLVLPSTGEALAAVALDVHSGDGQPLVGSGQRPRHSAMPRTPCAPRRSATAAQDHYHAGTDAAQCLQAVAKEKGRFGDYLSADQIRAVLVRVKAWADQFDGGRHGEDPA